MSEAQTRFVRGGVSVAALCALALGVGYLVSESVAPVYADARTRAALFDAAAPDVEAVSVGNSHSLALDFDALGVDGFHLWWPGGDVFEAERAVEEAVERAPGLDLVFVTVSPFVVDNGVVGTVEPGRGDLRRKTYVEYGDYSPLRSDWKLAAQAALAPVVRPDNWAGVAAAWGGRSDTTHIEPDGAPIAPVRGHLPIDDTERVGQRRAERHRALEDESLERNPGLCDDTARAYEAIAAAARERGVRVVLYTPAYTTSYAHAVYGTGDRCATRQMAARVAERFSNVDYFDFSQDEALSAPVYFRDADHMNVDGARAFSRRFRAALAGVPQQTSAGAAAGAKP